ALNDADGLVRASAVSLCDTGDETVKLLASMAVSDPVWQVRARALDAIVSSENPVVREGVASALSDSVRHVRRSALRAATERPGLLPVDSLSDPVISDPDWENRVEAAGALGASKDPAAYVGLDAAVADANEFVRAAAWRQRRALETAAVAR